MPDGNPIELQIGRYQIKINTIERTLGGLQGRMRVEGVERFGDITDPGRKLRMATRVEYSNEYARQLQDQGNFNVGEEYARVEQALKEKVQALGNEQVVQSCAEPCDVSKFTSEHSLADVSVSNLAARLGVLGYLKNGDPSKVPAKLHAVQADGKQFLSSPEVRQTLEARKTSTEAAAIKRTGFPEIPYDQIGKSIPIDENNPPKPESFFAPVVTNMFGDTDNPTLAGRMVATVYDRLVQRDYHKGYGGGDEVQRLLEVSKKTQKDFVTRIAEINKQRKAKGLPELPVNLTRPSGTDGFHFNGDARPSQDFLFYFGKSKAHYKHSEPEVRAYVTLNPKDREAVQGHFVDLAVKLYDEGIDFSGKAGSLFGVEKRTDNMVFYISASDQPKASGIIKQYLAEKGIGEGHVKAALPSQQEGLSWSMQPSEEQHRLWREISGSSKEASFNGAVAAMAMPRYMDRLAAAHRKRGDIPSAQQFEQEAMRIRRIIGSK